MVALRRTLAAALAAVLLGAAPRPIVFSAPAGDRPTGAPVATHPYDAILPNGRTVSPVGVSIGLPARALSVALTPDGNAAVVSSDAGPAVIDTRSMLKSAQSTEGAAQAGGVVAVRDPRDPATTLALVASRGGLSVYALSSAGPVLEGGAPIPTPGANPTRIAASADGRYAYVSTSAANTVLTFDIRARRFIGGETAGFAPAGIVGSGKHVYVVNEGVMEVRPASSASRTPLFSVPTFDSVRGSSLMAFGVKDDGSIDAGTEQSVKMDGAPDELQNVGGAHPSALAISRDGRFAFVCMTGVDRIAVVALSGVPRVVGGLSLRLFENSAIGSAPYGTQPDAIVASSDGNRLYVALAGVNAVAVIDASKPVSLRRLGLIPTGWYPAGLALSSDDRRLFVVNAKGTVGPGGAAAATLERIDLRGLPLTAATLSALRYNRAVAYAKKTGVVPTMHIDAPVRSSRIEHVVTVLLDDPIPDALIAQYASAGNYSADGGSARETQRVLSAGTATPYAVRAQSWGDDPDAYARAGFLFNGLQRAGRSYRDYGELLVPTGYLDGAYTFNIPVLSALASHVDLDYPGANTRTTNARRAAEFVRDIDPLVRNDAMPDYTAVWLPQSDPSDAAGAIGTIVDELARSPVWSSTAIFVVSDDPAHPAAIVVSPWAKRGYVSRRHVSTASVVKTEEELLGLPPLSLADLLASDMADLFGSTATAAGVDAPGRVETTAYRP